MSKKPNVLVFFTDQQRWDCSGLHGNPLDLMPNFDMYAQRHTHLSHSFTCQPVCGPARFCLQTGKYATESGCYSNQTARIKGETTLAHHFKEAGYQTGYIGKWHLGSDRDGRVDEDERGGYDYWLASNVLEFTSNAYETFLYDNDNQEQKLPGFRVDALADATIRYINDHQDEPFFLFTSYIEPHHQNHTDDYPPPEGYREKYHNKWIPPDLAALGGSTQQHIAGYYGMVKRLDEAFGRVVDALRSLNMLDNTIILFTSDHGNHFKTRNGEYKRSCDESSARVPSLLMGPGFEKGGRRDELCSLIDLPPTLLDAAGIDIPDYMQGNSILRLVNGENKEWQNNVYMQISEAQNGRAVRTERWKYGIDSVEEIDENGCSTKYEEQYLYDLQADPYELKNLINNGGYEPVKAELRKIMKARMKQAHEPEAEIISKTEGKPGKWHLNDKDIQGLGFTYHTPFFPKK